MSPEDEVRRGNLASQVLSNPVYTEAMLVMRAELVDKFQKTRFKERDERDELWRKLQTLEGIESYINRVMTTGKLGNQTQSLLNKLGVK